MNNRKKGCCLSVFVGNSPLIQERQAGLSIREIERATGVSKGIIANY